MVLAAGSVYAYRISDDDSYETSCTEGYAYVSGVWDSYGPPWLKGIDHSSSGSTEEVCIPPGGVEDGLQVSYPVGSSGNAACTSRYQGFWYQGDFWYDTAGPAYAKILEDGTHCLVG